jgi:hypothetical protein
MKKILSIAAVLLLAGVLVWFVRSRRADEKREAAYHAAVADFERGLRRGMSRAEVEKFLISRNVSYLQRSRDIYVKVGQDPSYYFICDAAVYVGLEFTYLPRQTEPTPLDNLGSISIARFGEDCL